MVTTEDLKRLPMVLRHYLVVMFSFLVLNLLVATFIYRVTDLNLLTSLFCATPGGRMTDTPLVAMDMGADASMVAMMQFVHMVFGMGCLLDIILLSDRLLEPEQAAVLEEQERQVHQSVRKRQHNRASLMFFTILGILGDGCGINCICI